MKKPLKINNKKSKGKTDRLKLIKNLLTKWELRKKTNLQIEKISYLCFCPLILSINGLLIMLLFGNFDN